MTRFGTLFDETGNRSQIVAQAPQPAAAAPTYNDDMVTGSVQSGGGYRAPAVTSGTLPPAPGAVVSNAPYQNSPLAGSDPYAQPTSVAPLPPVGGAPSVATLPPVAPGAVATVPRAAGWSPDGGTTVTLRQGETIADLSRRYGVPEKSLRAANNLTASSAVQPGQQIVIPTFSSGGAPAAVATTQPTTAPGAGTLGQMPGSGATQTATAGQGSLYTVQPGDSLGKIANRNGMKSTELARANGIDPAAPIRIGQKLTIPVPGQPNTQVAAVATNTLTDASLQPAAVPRLPAVTPGQPAVPAATVQQPPASAPPVQQQAAVQPTKPREVEQSGGVESAKAGNFRWPVRGRVISGFGAKASGERNDGINIEVPEGTPIKAAEGGTVIYAGNELKGYGNLVLVKHPNGFVSAYAHASEILVQRGDTVMRGQTLGKVGATGSVNRPQLHFEIRNGNRPVDPLPHLNG
ncbi:peptidoglycan DD-metalloendopeptidase family protein [Mongoliimonas terrestris]|uniref:peptidoglycan DD-metalloendopeptidase family protein n=1 Tax=Mongoliimonas terrestris TaxID=1709001 RepID=UPI001AECF5A7|nr:peptidoglycan DD-metalloendopeptidase family protein [Mongoliimonas terrestris]